MKEFAFMILVIAFMLSGCMAPKVSPNAAKLGIEFTLEAQDKCSSVSPKITVANVPAGTKKFKVSLVDLDVIDWDHGGGTILNDGSGVIPQGALKSGYNGPCPPSGSHRYEFKVNAIDAEDIIIGVGKNSQVFP